MSCQTRTFHWHKNNRMKCTLALSRSTVGRLSTNALADISTDRWPMVDRVSVYFWMTSRSTVGRCVGPPSTDFWSADSRLGWTFTRWQEQEKQASNTITHFKERLKVLKSTWLYTRAGIFMMLTRSMNVHVKQDWLYKCSQEVISYNKSCNK